MMEGSDLQYYLTWLKDQMKIPVSTDHGIHFLFWFKTVAQWSILFYFFLQNNEYLQTVARCLQMMLRIDEYRIAFVKVDGIST